MALYFERTGISNAPAIIFLHGIGTSGWMWERQVRALSDFHCIRVDLPGHGKSEAVPWLSLADTAQQIAEIIQKETDEGRAHIVGLSLGAYVTVKLLENHSPLLLRAVLSGITVSPMIPKAFVPPLLWFLSVQKKRKNSKRLPQTAELHLWGQEALQRNLELVTMDTYRAILTEVAVFQAPAVLQTITVPTLVLAGGRESKNILEAVRTLPQLMPYAKGRIAPGTGHGWNLENATLFNETVRAWVSDRPLPAGLMLLR